MSELGLISSDLADGDDYDSEKSEHSEPLGNNVHKVKNLWNDNNTSIKCVEHIEQEHHVACKCLQYNFYEEQRQKHIVYLGEQWLWYIEYVSYC